MYAKRYLSFAGFVTAGLLACTTQRLDPLPALSASTPPPMVSWSVPLEANRAQQPLQAARACLLSSTRNCMDLDSRPFEPCLVGARTCDPTAEPMWVAPPHFMVRPSDLEDLASR